MYQAVDAPLSKRHILSAHLLSDGRGLLHRTEHHRIPTCSPMSILPDNVLQLRPSKHQTFKSAFKLCFSELGGDPPAIPQSADFIRSDRLYIHIHMYLYTRADSPLAFSLPPSSPLAYDMIFPLLALPASMVVHIHQPPPPAAALAASTSLCSASKSASIARTASSDPSAPPTTPSPSSATGATT